jgi:hypothetical protein
LGLALSVWKKRNIGELQKHSHRFRKKFSKIFSAFFCEVCRDFFRWPPQAMVRFLGLGCYVQIAHEKL